MFDFHPLEVDIAFSLHRFNCSYRKPVTEAWPLQAPVTDQILLIAK